VFRALLSPILLTVLILQQPSASPLPQNQSPSSVEAGQSDQAPMHVDASVTPPVLNHSVDPEFSRAERKNKFKGTVQVYCWVEESGVPSHVRLVQGVRKDLDEKALAAVSEYRFKPATKDGKPVKVDLYIDVDFNIY
jgi:protein TonB